MHVRTNSRATLGFAVIGATAIALAPLQPLPDQVAVPQRAVEGLAVNLVAAIDPITPWVDTLKAAAANVKTLTEFYLEKPFPLLQTVTANLVTYLNELKDGDAGLIPGQILNNIQTFIKAPWSPGETVAVSAPPAVPDETELAFGEYLSGTQPESGNSPSDLNLGLLQVLVGQSLDSECYDDGNCLFVKASPIVNFLNTHGSGMLLGLLGPVLSPVVQLVRSFTAFGDYLKDGDFLGAINELINIPAKMTNAFLNGGGFLDLTGIVSKILPIPVDKVGVNLGGLLTSTPLDGSLVNADDPPTKWSGGTAFDGIAIDLGILGGSGIPVGPLGSMVGMGQFLSEKLLVTPGSAQAVAPAAAATAPPAVDAAPEGSVADSAVPAEAEVVATQDAPVESVAPASTATRSVPDADGVDAVVADAPVAPQPRASSRGARHGGTSSGDNVGSDSGKGGRSSARAHRGAA